MSIFDIFDDGIGGAVSNVLGTKNKYQANPYQPNESNFQYGGRPGGADEAANRYQGQANSAGVEANVHRRNAGAARNSQNDALGLMQQAANGNAPSRAEILGRAQADQAASAQQSLAASARGPAALALAQQNAAANTANAQTQIATQAMGQRADEMAQARNAYMQGATGIRGQDIGAQANARQFQLGMTTAEQNVRNAQLGAGQNLESLKSSGTSAANSVNAGVSGQNTQANYNSSMGIMQSAGSAMSSIAGMLSSEGTKSPLMASPGDSKDPFYMPKYDVFKTGGNMAGAINQNSGLNFAEAPNKGGDISRVVGVGLRPLSGGATPEGAPATDGLATGGARAAGSSVIDLTNANDAPPNAAGGSLSGAGGAGKAALDATFKERAPNEAVGRHGSVDAKTGQVQWAPSGGRSGTLDESTGQIKWNSEGSKADAAAKAGGDKGGKGGEGAASGAMGALSKMFGGGEKPQMQNAALNIPQMAASSGPMIQPQMQSLMASPGDSKDPVPEYKTAAQIPSRERTIETGSAAPYLGPPVGYQRGHDSQADPILQIIAGDKSVSEDERMKRAENLGAQRQAYAARTVETASGKEFPSPSPADMEKYLASTRGALYTYKDPNMPGANDGPNYGPPAAEDMAKNAIGRVVVTTDPRTQNLAIDKDKALKANMSAVAHVNDKVNSLAAVVAKKKGKS